MYARCLLFIATFQLLDTTMAVWNPNRSLYLVDLEIRALTFTKIFPLEVPSNIRQHDINNKGKYYAFCANPIAYQNCNYGNLAGTSASMAGQLPDICFNPVVYTVVPYLDEETGLHKECYHNQKYGHIFHFVYLLCHLTEEIPMERKIIYRVCYRDDEKQTMYASAVIQKPSLLGNASLQDERTYPFAFDDTHYFDYYTEDIVNASVFLYSEASNYTPTFLLPPELFPFAHQRTTLFHQMNLAPMKSTLTEGWKVCVNKLVDKLSRYQASINLYAGLIGVLQDDQGNDLYLGEYNGKKEIPIPSIFWLMLVLDSHYQGVAIIIHNRNYSTVEKQQNQLFHEEDCNAQVCRNADLGDILPPLQSPVHIVCCLPTVINYYFNLHVRNTLLRLP